MARPEAPDDAHVLVRTVEVRMGEDDQAGTEARLPFRPFTLEPGHERYVEVIGVLEDCEYYMPGSGNLQSTQPVRFDVLGQSLEADVPLQTAIEWRYGRAARCPRPRAK